LYERIEWCGKKCELMNLVGNIIVEGRFVTCDPRELVLDYNLGETKVGVKILSYPKDYCGISKIDFIFQKGTLGMCF